MMMTIDKDDYDYSTDIICLALLACVHVAVAVGFG